MKLQRNLPLQIAVVLVLALTIGEYIPVEIKSFLYAISNTIKGCLLLGLPIIIFSCVSCCMVSFRDRAMVFIVSLVAAVCVSNFISTSIAYVVGTFSLVKMNLHPQIIDKTVELLPSWNWQATSIVANEHALLAGFVLGSVFSIRKSSLAINIVTKLHKTVLGILNKWFVPVLPLLVLGFVLKMQHEGILANIIVNYAEILVIVIATYISYIWVLYFVAAGCNFTRGILFMRNMLPGALVGFSSMSSLAAMPVALRGVAKNSEHPEISQAVLPAVINVHLIGDSIGIPIFALVILTTFDLPLPDLQTYLLFAGFFVMAKFAVAAVPGGGIIVMIPILEKYLGFNPQMSALITAIYILLDPIITTTNVVGNGAFSVLFTKVFMRLRR